VPPVVGPPQYVILVINLIFICQVAADTIICDFFVELWANTSQSDDVGL